VLVVAAVEVAADVEAGVLAAVVELDELLLLLDPQAASPTTESAMHPIVPILFNNMTHPLLIRDGRGASAATTSFNFVPRTFPYTIRILICKACAWNVWRAQDDKISEICTVAVALV
jgi:hypothetical protein